MKRLRVVHTTEYSFSEEAFNVELLVRLRPVDDAGQHCDFFQIVTRPPAVLEELSVDAFGNLGHMLRLRNRLQRLNISAISTVTSLESRAASEAGKDKTPAREPDRAIYLETTRLVPLNEDIGRYALAAANHSGSIHARAEALCRRIHDDVRFRTGVTDDRTDAAQVLAFRQGVCQDFTHLALACARSLGWKARYVSGYVYTASLRGKAHRIAADASHAWLEVYDPADGWLGLDPANNQRADDRYIVVARGRDYEDVCPLQGVFEGGGRHQLRVSVDVQQI